MHPPIADPNRESKIDLALPTEGVFIRFHLGQVCAIRKATKELVVLPANIIVMLVCSLISTSILIGVLFPIISPPALWALSVFGLFLVYFLSIALSSLLSSQRKITVVLNRCGTYWRPYVHKQVVVDWSRFLFVVVWNSDVLLCTFAICIFIPREIFSSHQEMLEFIQIARELRRSRGATWREDWNGKTFGSNN